MIWEPPTLEQNEHLIEVEWRNIGNGWRVKRRECMKRGWDACVQCFFQFIVFAQCNFYGPWSLYSYNVSFRLHTYELRAFGCRLIYNIYSILTIWFWCHTLDYAISNLELEMLGKSRPSIHPYDDQWLWLLALSFPKFIDKPHHWLEEATR